MQCRMFVLSALAVAAPGLASRSSAEEIDWAPTFELAIERARDEDKFVMVDFYTTWCHWCRVLDQKTYSDPRVEKLSERMISVKVDAEKRRDIAAKYRISGYPTITFLNPDGTVRKSLRGFQPPEQFVPLLEQVLDTRSQQLHLSNQAASDQGSREKYAQVLALGGDHAAAAMQIDLLLRTTEGEARTELELDRWIYLALAEVDLGLVRDGLDTWTEGHPEHSRLHEAMYYLARVNSGSGRDKDARNLYEKVARDAVGRWFAEDARQRLEALPS